MMTPIALRFEWMEASKGFGAPTWLVGWREGTRGHDRDALLDDSVRAPIAVVGRDWRR